MFQARAQQIECLESTASGPDQVVDIGEEILCSLFAKRNEYALDLLGDLCILRSHQSIIVRHFTCACDVYAEKFAAESARQTGLGFITNLIIVMDHGANQEILCIVKGLFAVAGGTDNRLDSGPPPIPDIGLGGNGWSEFLEDAAECSRLVWALANVALPKTFELLVRS